MLLAVSAMQQHADPFRQVVWHTTLHTPITREEVQAAIDAGRLRARPVDADHAATRQQHIERVAYLVVHSWSDFISVEAHWGGWPVVDGNHRLAAAIFRGDKDIEVEFGGMLDEIRDMFGPTIASAAEAQWDDAALG